MTIALDPPMLGINTLLLLAVLDGLIVDAGGALYPAKDAQISHSLFGIFFPQELILCQFLDEFSRSNFSIRSMAVATA